MRSLLAVLLLTGCVSSAPSSGNIPDPDLPADGQSYTGAQAQSVFNWCYAKAREGRPGYSISAVAYQRSYTRTCMFQFNVPPDYVFVLMQNI